MKKKRKFVSQHKLKKAKANPRNTEPGKEKRKLTALIPTAIQMLVVLEAERPAISTIVAEQYITKYMNSCSTDSLATGIAVLMPAACCSSLPVLMPAACLNSLPVLMPAAYCSSLPVLMPAVSCLLEQLTCIDASCLLEQLYKTSHKECLPDVAAFHHTNQQKSPKKHFILHVNNLLHFRHCFVKFKITHFVLPKDRPPCIPSQCLAAPTKLTYYLQYFTVPLSSQTYR